MWLHRALGQALRSCPPGGSPVDWAQAHDLEGNVWLRILRENADMPMVEALRQHVDARLRRRERLLQEAEEQLRHAGTSSSSGTGTTHPRPHGGHSAVHPAGEPLLPAGRLPAVPPVNTGALSVPAARPIRPSMNPSVDLARPSARPSMRPTAMATDGVHGPARPSFAPHLRPRGTPDVPAGEAIWRTSWRSTPCGW